MRKDEYKSKPKQEYARREEYQPKKEYRPKKEYKPKAEYARDSFASESPAKPSFVFLDNVDGDYDTIQVSGDKFTIKDQLRQKFHALWDKAKRAWNVSR
ncbi:hypothetical protein SARC_13638 [Sphaeroforma arctica JP610]|uniref:Uncharacterized protein n=1 Tax=Sphaeroforma arctica JP610 TaxID=667725 RepID=A0A0L0FAN0_9EUKA|nr:hypothetical protein SARC_13638 [Sphaeroforma arctica JP610]KNC73804.1 hypothetical protein SARC_13638 [Sphaeroforma arctica JP610]|eukprot:XP_014147706.1 hypothetical protein SARC_13638 [Sphaeroforma arctica JP610]